MKLYYISCRNSWGSGIQNKINNQLLYFTKVGLKTDYINIQFNKNNLIRLIMPFVSMYNYRNLDKIEKNSICFIRYNGIDLNGILYLRKLRKKM